MTTKTRRRSRRVDPRSLAASLAFQAPAAPAVNMPLQGRDKLQGTPGELSPYVGTGETGDAPTADARPGEKILPIAGE